MENPLSGACVLVTGGSGFLGRYVCAMLEDAGAQAISVSRRSGFDLRNEAEALTAVMATKPDIIVHLAAIVGGIGANMKSPATFFRDNLSMGMNVIHAAAIARTRLICVGTLCSYPREGIEIPFKEADFWMGFPEETNAPYGIAKKALLVMCQAYQKQHGLKYGYLVPSNLFGPADNFDDNSSHVIPALIRRYAEALESDAKEVVCWGTGKATRSFLHVRDAAKATVLACSSLDYDGPVNLGGTQEISMKDLAKLISDAVGYKGKTKWDHSKPDGQPRRAVDSALVEELLKWKPETSLEDGIKETVEWYVSSRSSAVKTETAEK